MTRRGGGVGWGGVKYVRLSAIVSLAHSHPPSENMRTNTELGIERRHLFLITTCARVVCSRMFRESSIEIQRTHKLESAAKISL